ncbi:MAG: C_GCAxxG_C_C family protein [Oscillospiraceae bacterium]|nr:C_GCAxxG_C_C family protein [Oscillospiraceae bacterium]
MKLDWTEEEIAQRAEQAAGMHAQGCNCAQSVFLMFASEAGLSEETARRIFQGFGGGLAVGEACGAFTGAAAALGLLGEAVPPGDPEAKAAFSGRVRALAEKFRTEAGALRCAELKPEDPEKQKLVCRDYIRLGVRLAAEALRE